jgi:uncharacterized membrane protein YfcA
MQSQQTLHSVESTVSFSTVLRLYFFFFSGLVILVLLAIVTIKFFNPESFSGVILRSIESLSGSEFFIYVGIGFLAQVIDGALGMAYGVTSTSFLMSVGVSPAVASAGVHAAEVVTTGFSGLSHWKFGNVTKALFFRLALPGAIGAALGAYVLASFDGDQLKPFVSFYLLLMGVFLLSKTVRTVRLPRLFRQHSVLGLVGGFVDSSGGGGWGAIVTSTLIGSGHTPRFTIGTVNAVEFIVAASSTGVFSVLIGLENWDVILGLILGGALAAPLGAYVCTKVRGTILMSLVGILIIALSIRTLLISTKIL